MIKNKEQILQAFSVKEDDKKFVVYNFLLMLVVHAYKFLNYLPTGDSAGLTKINWDVSGFAGRWLTGIASILLSSQYDLQWVEGIVFSAFLSIALLFVAKILKFNSKTQKYLFSAIIITSQTITATFFYPMIAGGNLLGLCLAVFALYLVINFEEIWINAFASLCICASLGCYQIYVLFIGAVFALYLVKLLQTETPYKKIIALCLRCVIVVAIGGILYWLCTKLSLYVFKLEKLGDYQGISKFGQVTPKHVLLSFGKMFHGAMIFFRSWAVISAYSIINYVILACIAFFYVKYLICSKTLNVAKKIYITILIIALVPITYAYYAVSTDVFYHSLMQLGMNLVYIVPFLLPNIDKSKFKNVYIALLCVLCFYNFCNANIAYHQAEITYERTRYNLTTIHAELDKINTSKTNKLLMTGKFKASSHISQAPAIFGVEQNTFLHSQGHFSSFSKMYYDRNYIPCTDEEARAIMATDEYKQLDAFPHGKYVALINNVLVVKLPDDSN